MHSCGHLENVLNKCAHIVSGCVFGCRSSQDGSSRFPKLEDCAHFHYDFVDFGPLQVRQSLMPEIELVRELVVLFLFVFLM